MESPYELKMYRRGGEGKRKREKKKENKKRENLRHPASSSYRHLSPSGRE
jgi:hypothetical protein